MTHPAALPPLHDLIVHRGPMLLLDRVVSVDAASAVTEVDITEDRLFCQPRGMPAWVGLEYMAQTIAVWAGNRARAEGHAPRMGYMLGTRRYDAKVPWFRLGNTFRVSARCELIGDNGLGQFACLIVDASGMQLADAMVSVYETQQAP